MHYIGFYYKLYFMTLSTPFRRCSSSKGGNYIKEEEEEEVFAAGCSIPHTTHCLPNGQVMISCLGNGPKLEGKGNFVMIDGKDWKVKGTYLEDEKDIPPFGYYIILLGGCRMLKVI